jgi:Flp pilus assembly protein TadG
VSGQRRPAGDDGNATVEFVYLAILLMIPLVYVIISAFQAQRTAFAVAEAARQAGRAYVTAGGGDEATDRALFAANLAMTDQGIAELPPGALQITSPDGGFCAGATVTVTLTQEVELPLLERLTNLTVTGEHTETIDEFRNLDRCGP